MRAFALMTSELTSDAIVRAHNAHVSLSCPLWSQQSIEFKPFAVFMTLPYVEVVLFE